MTIIQALKSKACPVAAVAFLWSLASGLLGLALPLYLAAAGHTPREWGLLAGVVAFAMIPAEPAWGWFADRLGIAAPLVVSLVASALLAPLYLLAGGLGALVAIQVARGLIHVAGAPVCRKALANSLGPERSATGLGIFQAAVTAGSGAGTLVGGYFVSHWGHAAAFYAVAALSLAGAVIAIASRGTLRALQGAVDAPARAPAQAPGRLGRTAAASLAGLAVVAAALYAGNGAGRSFLPILGTTVLRLDATQIGILLTITSLFSGLLMVFVGRASDRWGRWPLIVGGLVLLAVALLGYTGARGFGSLAAVCLLHALAVSAAAPAALAWASGVAPPERQGQIIGLYGSFEDVGLMVGPAVCGYVWDAYGPRAAYAACSAIVVLGAIAALALRGDHRTRARAQSLCSLTTHPK